jgi:hypothetical protein
MYPLAPTSIWDIMHTVNDLPQSAEAFYTQKQFEEKDLRQDIAKQREHSEVEEANANPIDELPRGPYLDPNAREFVPSRVQSL